MNKYMSEVKDLESLVKYSISASTAPGQISLGNSLGNPNCLLSPGPCLLVLLSLYFQFIFNCHANKAPLPKYVSIKWNVLFHPSCVSVIAMKSVLIEDASS